MKKTLITLAALAAASLSASAGVLTFTQPTVGAATDTSTTPWAVAAGSFEFTFCIETPNFVTDETLLMTVSGGKTSCDSSSNSHQAYALSKTESGYTLTAGRGYMSAAGDFSFNGGNSVVTFTTVLSEDVVYTMKNAYEGGGWSKATLAYEIDGVMTEVETLSFESWVLRDGDVGNVGTDMIVKTYTIPEPATATLSLLALAGLAARRRRK